MQVTGFTIFWIILAVVNIAYGIMIRAIGSGTAFFLVWILMGGACVLLACAAQLHLWGMLPAPLRMLILAAAACAAAIVIGVFSLIGSRFQEKGTPGADYLIVLGAQMHDYGPSMVLEYRLEAAEKYLKENPHTRCIVTGGQGYNEPCTEAEGMEAWLLAHGIEKERILKEETSGNTVQNITNAKQIIKEDSPTDHPRILIVTNNFHLYRAIQIAKKQGLTQVTGIAAYSTPRYLPNNAFREVLGVIKDKLSGNM